MGNIYSNSYTGTSITVDEMVKDPTWIPQRTLETLDGAFLEDLIFRNGGTNQGSVAFRENAAALLNDEAENVAEGAEIPVANMNLGKARVAVGQNNKLGIRVTRQMITRNSVDAVTMQQTALQNTIIATGIKATINAFEAADVPEIAAESAWTEDGSKPDELIFDAIEHITSAKTDRDGEEGYFNYSPDTLVISPTRYNRLLRNERIQKLFIGDNASANPLYTGIAPRQMFNLNVATSRYIAEDEAYVLESGVAGFISTEDPLQMTPMYEEGGASGSGGPNQTWRSDAFRARIIAVDNPQAVVKLTGI